MVDIMVAKATKSKPNLSPLEDAECKAFVQYLEVLQSQGHDIIFSHMANETFTKSWKTKNRNKAMGVRSGLPDYIIIINGLVVWLEMKRRTGGVISATQKEWIERLEQAGQNVHVARGLDEAMEVIGGYL